MTPLPPDSNVLICLPVTESPPIAGARIGGACHGCGVKVWMAPSSKEFLPLTNLVFMCVPCAMQSIKESGETVEVKITPSQLREIAENL